MRLADPRWSIDGRTVYVKDNNSESQAYRLSIPFYPSMRNLQELELVYDHGTPFEYDILPGEDRFIIVPDSTITNRIEVATGWLNSMQLDR